MEIEQLPLAGALLLVPRTFNDERGFFKETYSRERYRGCGVKETFVQDNLSRSHRNVLRGLHGDARMAKLIGVVHGSAFDVIVDVRPRSPTYRRWYGTRLTADEGCQLYVPRGFLHGFLALEDETIFAYKQSAPYEPSTEYAIAWDDPDLEIEWPLGGRQPTLSGRDARAPSLREFEERNKRRRG
ncbi:MAG: dTDP-4-dehydrorhamnose 3,5-epimerase [Candidatus Eremiobacteraeota bacterium]|nr:dTDP-4-dehydrorhamnose 3,5-epimerase [Candidatus Eremiobacteraeota bacterium]